MKCNYFNKINAIIFMIILFFSIVYYYYFYKFKEGKKCKKGDVVCQAKKAGEDVLSEADKLAQQAAEELDAIQKIIDAIRGLKKTIADSITSIRGIPGKFDVQTGGVTNGKPNDIFVGKTESEVSDALKNVMSDMKKQKKDRW